MIGLEAHIRRKSYRSPPTVALEDLRFTVEPGAFVAIVGPSGAGKSTLLNIVAGLDREFEGEVRLGHSEAHPEDHVTRLGFVFQQPRLMPWLSVLDNVRLVLEQSPESSERARALLAEVGLTEFESAFPGQLSGGMQRRAALARAFAVKPDLLLMDEPYLSLDDPTAWRLREQLMVLWEEYRPTVLYVTHDLGEALTLSERILFLSSRPGSIVLDHLVELARPRRAGDRAVAALQERLLAAHPHLLSGVVGGAGRATHGDTGLAASPGPRAMP